MWGKRLADSNTTAGGRENHVEQPSTQLKSSDRVPTQGRRERVAEFIHAHRDLIKEGFRAQIVSRDRSFYDSSDFFSTVQRRADRLASLGDDESSRDILRTLHEIMLEALADHARQLLRDRTLRRSLAEDAAHADGTSSPLRTPAERRGLKALHLTAEELDLARLRASGLLHRQVAAALGVSAAVVRMRWQRLVGKARQEAWGQAQGHAGG